MAIGGLAGRDQARQGARIGACCWRRRNASAVAADGFSLFRRFRMTRDKDTAHKVLTAQVFKILVGSLAQTEISGKYNGIRNFTEDEIETITSGYTTLIGKGGFGEVYRGVLHYDDLVAVKRYIRGDLIQEFMEEVRIHSQINHKNIVKLISYCRGENSLLMVTEYISNGNLEDILHNRKLAMPLDTRLGIAIGCAQALCHMHSMHLSTGSLVCHGDIKPANIFLDDNLTAKISDFGCQGFFLVGSLDTL
uniref:Protein kinase domain-containing protein n=1 Tax=Oryza barthii TaxID=65489 RepID=A0A0D3HN02_9ORYZ